MKLGVRIWILILFILFSIMAINPKFDISGVEIKSIGEFEREQGLEVGEVIKNVNGRDVNTVDEFKKILEEDIVIEEKDINLVTDKGSISYKAKYSLGFEVDENLTITSTEVNDIQVGDKLKVVNGNILENEEDWENIRYELLSQAKLEIKTDKKEYAFLVNKEPKIDVKLPSKNNLKQGLDLEGGTRILLEPIKEEGSVSTKDILDLMTVLRNRLNVYGLTDLKLRAAESGDTKYVLVEMAGVSKDEVEGFIAKQGNFEAKIGDEVVFRGGKGDIPFVCRDDGTCAGVRNCDKFQDGYGCRFQFSIKLSPGAAKNHARITENINVVTNENGNQILEKQIEFYLDGNLIDSLNIDADLKGNEATDILITGSGAGVDEGSAFNNALDEMDKLQTVLITGSLPFKLEIAKLDSISPIFGKNFIKNVLLVGLISIIAVLVVIYVRYRNFRVLLPMAITLVSEILIILGLASFIGWNLDLAAIAGIIAAVGTGVDDQIVITDEIMKGEQEKFYSWKEKIKKAFFIILVAYFSTIAAMLPMWNAAAGLIRGFAVTIIMGVTIGVLVTRPAFAAMLEKLMERK